MGVGAIQDRRPGRRIVPLISSFWREAGTTVSRLASSFWGLTAWSRVAFKVRMSARVMPDPGQPEFGRRGRVVGARHRGSGAVPASVVLRRSRPPGTFWDPTKRTGRPLELDHLLRQFVDASCPCHGVAPGTPRSRSRRCRCCGPADHRGVAVDDAVQDGVEGRLRTRRSNSGVVLHPGWRPPSRSSALSVADGQDQVVALTKMCSSPKSTSSRSSRYRAARSTTNSVLRR